jgi:plasmid maintenance system antidote protein VapI
MSDTPSLLQQLANRAKRFHSSTNISQAAMAKAIRVAEGNYSKFLAGKRGLSAESTCSLLTLINMPAQQAIATLTQKPLSSTVMQLQESGKRLKFNSSAALKLDSTGLIDTGSSISSTPAGPPDTIEAIIAALLKLKQADRQTVIAAIVKAVPNPAGSTAPNNQRFNRRY